MWKENLEESLQHYLDWWQRKGLVVTTWGSVPSETTRREVMEAPPPAANVRDIYLNASMRAKRAHYSLSRSESPLDVLPTADTDMGPGSLALFLGCEPGFSPETVWFEPCWMEVEDPESLPPLTFNPENRWWKLTEETVRASAELGRGRYFTGCPDLVENVDILSSLREPQRLMLDMVERPEWVEQKVREITRVWCEAYNRIYDIIKQNDGGSMFGAFRVWGPGKTAKLQCDASAMFSPEMFDQFVVPELTAQCEWLDNSLYHLDGTQAMGHLESLLAIEALDAIEWTPQAGIETGGNARWYPLYRRILEAGKSVQIMSVHHGEIAPLLNAIGTQGVYFMTSLNSMDEVREVSRIVKPFRR